MCGGRCRARARDGRAAPRPSSFQWPSRPGDGRRAGRKLSAAPDRPHRGRHRRQSGGADVHVRRRVSSGRISLPVRALVDQPARATLSPSKRGQATGIDGQIWIMRTEWLGGDPLHESCPIERMRPPSFRRKEGVRRQLQRVCLERKRPAQGPDNALHRPRAPHGSAGWLRRDRSGGRMLAPDGRRRGLLPTDRDRESWPDRAGGVTAPDTPNPMSSDLITARSRAAGRVGARGAARQLREKAPLAGPKPTQMMSSFRALARARRG